MKMHKNDGYTDEPFGMESRLEILLVLSVAVNLKLIQ
jgi:hypothetical protein